MRVRAVVLLVLFVLVPVFGKENFQQPGPIHITREGQRWAEATLHSMTLEQKVGQILMVRAATEFYNVSNPQLAQLRRNIREFHVGGVLLTVPADGAYVFKNQPYEAAMLTNLLQRDAEQPLIFAADFERGLSNRFYGATVFPSAMAFGAAGKTEYVEEFARIVADEARAIGVHWTFFPIADVNSDPRNPIINTRAFGEDPDLVGAMTVAYIRSSTRTGLLTTVKHFPGHGDTSTDTHLGVARVNGSRERLEEVELKPFRDAIDAGADAVMTAHVTVPALEPDPNRVASLSHKIVTELLKEKIGFQGIVVSDALDMGAITQRYSSGRAAVEALKAGNDIILIPADLGGAHAGLVSAVRSGEISEARLEESVRKVLYAKASLGLYRARLVDLNAVSTAVGKPGNQAFAQVVADSAISLIRDNGHVLPLQREGTSGTSRSYVHADGTGTRLLNVVLTDDMRGDMDHVFERELRRREPDEVTLYVDSRSAPAMTDATLAAVEKAEKVVVAVYIFPSAGGRTVPAEDKEGTTVQDTASLAAPATRLLHQILAHAGDKTVVVAMGSPYLASTVPEVQNYLCTFSNAPVSETAAAKALFGEISIHGRMPVTVPGIAQRGAGFDRPAQDAGWKRSRKSTAAAGM